MANNNKFEYKGYEQEFTCRHYLVGLIAISINFFSNDLLLLSPQLYICRSLLIYIDSAIVLQRAFIAEEKIIMKIIEYF